MRSRHAEAEAKVFENAGGYAPTVGIIGAVLGLIQVMKNLANIDEVGHGIAVAFVATVYGVGVREPVVSAGGDQDQGSRRTRGNAAQGTDSRRRMRASSKGLNPKLIRRQAGSLHADGRRVKPKRPRKTGAMPEDAESASKRQLAAEA